MRSLDDLYYDFDRDAWMESPSIRARWDERDLPPPATSPSPGRWFDPPRRRARLNLRQPDLALYASFLGAVVLALLMLLNAWGTIALLTIGAVGYLFARQDKSRLRSIRCASGRDLALFEGGDLDVCLVEIAIVRQGETVGWDRGVVWFEGGRLLFSGHRTSFAIGGEDVLPRSRWAGYGGTAFGVPNDALPLRVATGEAHVRFEPLAHDGDWTSRERRFSDRFHAFRLRPPRSRAPRQWPPFEA